MYEWETQQDNLNRRLADASEAGSLDVVKKLHEAGADVSHRNGLTLRYACFNGRLEVVKYLIEVAGADVHAKIKSKGSRTVLEWANVNKHPLVVNYLNKHIRKDKLKVLLA